MSSHLGFRNANIPADGRRYHFVDWVEQPDRPASGPPKPRAMDSAMVTVQIEATLNTGTIPNGSYLADAVLWLAWAAAGEAQMFAEIDLLPGTSFSVAASAVKAEVQLTWSAPSTLGYSLNATLGRSPRAGGSEGPTRTRYLGSVANTADSAVATIPPFAKSFRVVTATPGAGTSFVVTQYSQTQVVQSDIVAAAAGVIITPVNARADSFTVTNGSGGARDIQVVFRIGL